MQPTDSRVFARLAFLALVLALGACSSTSGKSSATVPPSALAGINPAPSTNVVPVATSSTITPDMFLDAGYCPPVQIRPGTESVMIYERNHEEDPAYVRFQGSITKTARECHTLGGTTLTIKVGIAGRLTAGPKGAAGKYTLPLRVAVVKQHGNTVFYSQVSKVVLTIAAPAYAADFTQVVDNVSFQIGPDDRDLIVYVGYDEGKPKPKQPKG